jgi:hypothetical protein
MDTLSPEPERYIYIYLFDSPSLTHSYTLFPPVFLTFCLSPFPPLSLYTHTHKRDLLVNPFARSVVPPEAPAFDPFP